MLFFFSMNQYTICRIELVPLLRLSQQPLSLHFLSTFLRSSGSNVPVTLYYFILPPNLDVVFNPPSFLLIPTTNYPTTGDGLGPY